MTRADTGVRPYKRGHGSQTHRHWAHSLWGEIVWVFPLRSGPHQYAFTGTAAPFCSADT